MCIFFLCYRFICDHLREYSSGDVTARIHFLRLLASVDESCGEVVELVGLMMDIGDKSKTVCQFVGSHRFVSEIILQWLTSHVH